MPFEAVQSDDPPKPTLPFSPAVRANGFIFVSGQASVGDDGKIVADTFENEFRRSMDNVKRILAAAGATLADVVQVRAYVDDPANLPAYNELYREYFKPPLPVRTTIMQCLAGVVKFEIDVVAVER